MAVVQSSESSQPTTDLPAPQSPENAPASGVLLFLSSCSPPMSHLLATFLRLGLNDEMLKGLALWNSTELIKFFKDVAEDRDEDNHVFTRVVIHVLIMRFGLYAQEIYGI